MFIGSSVLFRVGLGRVRGLDVAATAGRDAGATGALDSMWEGARVGELDRESKSPPCRKMRDKGGAPSRIISVSALVRRRILFAGVWLGRLVWRAERGLLPTFLSFGSAISVDLGT